MNPNKSDETLPRLRLKGWHICVIFVVVLVLWGFGWWVPSRVTTNGAAAGQFGDKFGAVNALFSGLAFAGLIVTLLMQREELALQRDEMKQMREQYERTATAQEASEKVFQKQATATLIAARLQGFASIVDLYIARGTHGTHIPLDDTNVLPLNEVLKGMHSLLNETNKQMVSDASTTNSP